METCGTKARTSYYDFLYMREIQTPLQTLVYTHTPRVVLSQAYVSDRTQGQVRLMENSMPRH